MVSIPATRSLPIVFRFWNYGNRNKTQIKIETGIRGVDKFTFSHFYLLYRYRFERAVNH
jgi:hypothetical protein